MMERKFRSIRDKLVFFLSLSAIIALLLSFVAIFIYYVDREKEHTIETIEQIASILSKNLSAPIEFDDTESSISIMESISLGKNILSAHLHSDIDELFAEYKTERLSDAFVLNDYAIEDISEQKSFIDTNYIVVRVPVYIDDEIIASLALVSNTAELKKVIFEIFITQLIVFVVVITIIVLLAYRYEHIFTNPIIRLKRVMRSVADDKDYTIAIDDKRNDEFQNLYDGFNYMISAINTQNTQLQHYSDKISTLLDNAGQGFLTIDENLIIDDEYSKECERLLGQNLGGVDISELLFSSKKELVTEAIADALDSDDETIRGYILSLLPAEVVYQNRALKLEYKVLQNKKVMMIISDITTQKRLQHRIKQEQELLKMIVEIVSDSDGFFDTKREYEHFAHSLDSYIDDNHTESLAALYRIIHTFKGSFAQYYMHQMVDFLHNIESSLADMKSDKTITNERLLTFLKEQDFIFILDNELEKIEEILGDDFFSESNYVKIDSRYLKELQEKVIGFISKDDENISKYADVFKRVLNLSNVKLINLLKPYASLIEQLSQKLDKQIYPLEIQGSDDIVVPLEFRAFTKTLVHLFRNSIDHGIEDAESRVALDKDEYGKIECSFRMSNDKLEIIISDDGAGIDRDKLIAKAIEAGVISSGEGMSDSEIFNLIFLDNFSTKDEVSTLSGRGVGMSAIKAELDRLGGSIEITSTKNIGTSVRFLLPTKE